MKDSSKPEKKMVKFAEGQREVDNAEVEIVNIDGLKVAGGGAKLGNVAERTIEVLQKDKVAEKVEKEKGERWFKSQLRLKRWRRLPRSQLRSGLGTT